MSYDTGPLANCLLLHFQLFIFLYLVMMICHRCIDLTLFMCAISQCHCALMLISGCYYAFSARKVYLHDLWNIM